VEGNIWIGTCDAGVSEFDGANWTTYTTSDGLANNRINIIAIDAEGNKWFGSEGGGVSRFDGTNWTTYTTSDGLIDNRVYAIAIDKESNKWFGTYRVISKFDGSNWTTYSGLDSLAIYNIHAIAIDAEGNKWFGTTWSGVSRFDSTNWTNFTTSDGLAGNYVNAITIDSKCNKWFGTNGGGVSRLSECPFPTDCNGVVNGFAFIDACKNCTGGNTGIVPVLDKNECSNTSDNSLKQPNNIKQPYFRIFPNPNDGQLNIVCNEALPYQIIIINMVGKVVLDDNFNGNTTVDTSHLMAGYYAVVIKIRDKVIRQKLIIL
jgi:streptogramin lyase